MNKNLGWVKLWRDQFSHEISERKPWCDGYAWSYLYSRANFRPAIVNFRNQYIPVERGQFVTSELKLSKIFGWSRRRTNSFLTSLERGGMCVNRRTQRYIIISICNYDKFQSTNEEERTIDVTTDVTTGEQQVHIDKNNKNEKNKTYNQNSLEILSYLNEKTGRKYKISKHIESRLRDGATVEDCRRVIDTKVSDPYFIQNPKYLNPETLFSPAKFDRYRNESIPLKVETLKSTGNSACLRCGAQVPDQDKTPAGCIYCENKTAEVRA